MIAAFASAIFKGDGCTASNSKAHALHSSLSTHPAQALPQSHCTTPQLLAHQLTSCSPTPKDCQGQLGPCLYSLVVVQSQSTRNSALVSPVDSCLRAGEQALAALPSGITGNAAKPLQKKYLYAKQHFIMVTGKPAIARPSRCQTVSQS